MIDYAFHIIYILLNGDVHQNIYNNSGLCISQYYQFIY